MRKPSFYPPEEPALPSEIEIGEARLDLRARIMENRRAELAGERLLADDEIDAWLDELDREDEEWWEGVQQQAGATRGRKPQSPGI